MPKLETDKTAAHINKLAESQDIDDILSYLSLVNGIDGAILFDDQGWVVGKGEESRTNLEIEGVYLLYHLRESLRELAACGAGPIEYQVTFAGERFLWMANLEKAGRFFLVVSGAKGSYDLFRIRCERAADTVSRVLRDRRWLRGM